MLPTSQIRATLAIVLVTAGLAPAASAQTLKLRYGIAAFGEVDPLKSADVLSACGADYIEPALSKTVALAQPALDEALARVAAGRARIETANWFMPGTDIALTGPAVDRERIGRYLDQSLALASRLGVKVIVFGSPGARSYPAGFSAETAWTQLRDFLRQAGESGQLYGSVTTRDIAIKASSAGTEVLRTHVLLDQPIKTIGLYKVRVALHPEVVTEIQVNVARTQDEADAQARGEVLTGTISEREEARLAAEQLFEAEALAKEQQTVEGSSSEAAPAKEASPAKAEKAAKKEKAPKGEKKEKE